jgi:hypothetical protein
MLMHVFFFFGKMTSLLFKNSPPAGGLGLLTPLQGMGAFDVFA